MKIVCRPRGMGKTIDLIKHASETGSIIVCGSMHEGDRIKDMARSLGLQIKPPVSYHSITTENNMVGRGSRHRPSILIDDIDRFFAYLSKDQWTIEGMSLTTENAEIQWSWEHMNKIIWTWQIWTLLIAVPKKRGKGYLKTPLYHSYQKWAADIEDKFECEISGLDGHLDILPSNTKIRHNEDLRHEYERGILDIVANSFSAEIGNEVSEDEFFDALGVSK